MTPAPQGSRSSRDAIIDSPVWCVAAAPVGVALGALAGNGWLVATLPVLLMFPGYWRGLSLGSAPRVFLLSLVWAATLSICLIAWTMASPSAAGAAILKAVPYREEMFDWIRTGLGTEGDPSRFLPLHALHLVLFALASWVSGGFLGLLMGSVLMGYMSYYVGSVALASSNPALGIIVAWHPWSVLRVIGFVAIGVSLSLPLQRGRIFAFHHKLMIGGLGLVVTDAILKAVLAEPWRQILRSVLGM